MDARDTDKPTLPTVHHEVDRFEAAPGRIVYLSKADRIPRLEVGPLALVRTVVLRQREAEAVMARRDLREARQRASDADQRLRLQAFDLIEARRLKAEAEQKIATLRERLRELRDQMARHDDAEAERVGQKAVPPAAGR